MSVIERETTEIGYSWDLLHRLDNLLGSDAEGLHVSIYCPAGRLPDEAEKAMIAFKNETRKAAKILDTSGKASAKLMAHLDEVAELSENSEFWHHQRGGVAVFLNDATSEFLEVSAPLKANAIVGRGFHLKPLMALASNLDIYYLLALSQNQVILYRGSKLGLRAVECPGLPENYAAAIDELGYPEDSTKQAAAQSNFKARWDQLRVYFEEINDAVTKLLSGKDIPLIVAGDTRYEPIYREVNTYEHLSEEYLAGNPEHEKPDALSERAVDALRNDFDESLNRALVNFQKLDETRPLLVAKGLEAVLKTGALGQVETAFLPADVDVWGTFDREGGTIARLQDPSIDSGELNELAARQILATGGEVFFLENRCLPEDTKAIGLLRWKSENL